MTQPIQTPRICTDDEANIIFQCMDEVKSEARKGKTSTVSFRKMQEKISKYIENGEVYMNLHADKPEQKLQQQKSRKLFDALKRSRDAVNEITKTISQGQKTLRQEYSAVVRKYYESVVRLEKNLQTIGNLILETVEKQKKTERNESVEAIRETLAKVFKDIRSAVQFLKIEFKPLEMGLYKGKTLSDRAEECKQMVENSIAGKFKKLNENYPYLVNNIHSKRAMSLLNCDINNIRVLIEYLIANFKYSEHRDSQREVMDTACSDATKAIDECLKPTLLDIDEKFDSIKKTMEASKNSMQKLDETKESEMLDYVLYLETSKAKDWAHLLCKFPAFVIFAKTYQSSGVKHVIDAAYQIPSHLQPLRGAFWKLLLTLLRLLHEKEAQDLEYDLVAAEQKIICILLKKAVFKTRKALFMMQAIKNMQIIAEDRRTIMSLPNQILNAISSIYILRRINHMFYDQSTLLVNTKQILIQHTKQIDNMVERLNNEMTQESDLDTGSLAIASNHINQRHAIFELSNIEIIKRLGEEHEKINEDLIKRFNERSRKRKDMGMACEHDHSYNFDCEFSKSNEFVLANEANERGGVAKGIATTLNEGIKQTSNETKKSLDEQHLYLMRKIANFFSTLSKLYNQRSEQIKLKYQISLSKKELDNFKTNLQHNEQIQELAQRNINCLEKHSDLAISITNSASLVSQAKDLLDEIDCSFYINQNEYSANQNEHKNVLEKIKAFVCNLFEKGPESQDSITHKIKDAVDILEQFNDERIVADGTQSLIIVTERCEEITILLDYFLDFNPIQENENNKNVKNLIRAQERKLIAWIKREGCSLICYENALMLRTGYTPREFYYGKKMDVFDEEDDAVEVDEKNLNNMDDTPKVKKYKNCDSAEAVDLTHSTTHISSTTDMDEQNKNNHENAVESEKQGACTDCGTSTEVSGKDDDTEPKKVKSESRKPLNVKNNCNAIGHESVKPDRYEANIGSAPENKMTFDRICLDSNKKSSKAFRSDRGFEGSIRAQKQVTVPQYMNESGNKGQFNILKDKRNLLPLHAKENFTAEVECEKRQKDLHPLEESGARNMPLKEQPDCGTKNKKLSGKSNAKTSWQRILLISTFVALAAGLIVTVVYFRWYGNPK